MNRNRADEYTVQFGSQNRWSGSFKHLYVHMWGYKERYFTFCWMAKTNTYKEMYFTICMWCRWSLDNLLINHWESNIAYIWTGNGEIAIINLSSAYNFGSCGYNYSNSVFQTGADNINLASTTYYSILQLSYLK